MILSVLATLALAVLAMAPGWQVMRGRQLHPGMVSAAMAASLVLVMLASALIGIAVHAISGFALPALTMAPVSLVAILAALKLSPGKGSAGDAIEWEGIALGVLFVVYGLFVQALAVRPGDEGALIVHGWFNADWFKHLGHVSALGNFGLPAADNFNQAGTLHYYWLSYILPGAGLAIGNDAWGALAAANTIITFLFTSVFYGVLRRSGGSRTIALLIGTLALFVSAPYSFVFQIFFGLGLEGVINFPAAPKGPALLTLSQYIPQHMLVLVLLLGWFLLRGERTARIMALVALASAMTISTLLGAIALVAYGLLRLWSGREKAIPELAAMVVLSGLLVVLLQIVQIGNVDSAIESPLLTNEPVVLPLHERIASSLALVAGNVGLPFLIAVLGLYYWRPAERGEREVRAFAIALIAAAFLAAIAVEIVLTERLAIEARIRAVNLPGIANAIVGTWLFTRFWAEGGRRRLLGVGVLVLVVLLALPSAGLRTAWHGRIGDTFTTTIPSDDRGVLAAMRDDSDRRAIVLQYPEPPVLADEPGDDAWAAIRGQRAVTASQRATDYPLAQPRIESAERFFAGDDEPIAPDVDLVYLSRALHPESYDALVARMEGEREFERLECYEDACLFSRRESISP